MLFRSLLNISGTSGFDSLRVYGDGSAAGKFVVVKPETATDVAQLFYWNGSSAATLYMVGTTQMDTLKYGGVTLSNSVTGTGSMVLSASPTLVTPALGTPSSVTLTNATGLPVSGITASTSTALGVGSIELGHATDTTIEIGRAHV